MGPRLAPAWVLPATVVVLGGVVVVSARAQRDRVEAHLERRAKEHVGSVARLLAQSTLQTAEAVDLAYLMVEARLHASLLRIEGASPARRPEVAAEEGLVVWRLGAGEDERGATGPLDPEALARAWREPRESLFELSLSEADLACLVDEHQGPRSLACIDGGELSRLRARAGPGRLFAEIIAPPLVYVALEDERGVIASSPGLPPLPGFEEDPELGRTRDAPLGAVTFRRRGGLREGLSPFVLPDESRVVLRVGLDATLEEAISKDIAERHRLLLAVVTLAVVLAVLAAAWTTRRERERARVEAALAASEAESEHWRGIGALAATVAHEVRNPLNAIQMSAQRLAREFEVPPHDRPDFDALVGMLRSEGARVEAVVTEFLELGRPLELERRRVSSSSLLRQALAPLEARAAAEGKGLDVEDLCAGEVELDPRRVVQIVDNLVRNALDATPAGGRVRVRGRCSPAGLEVEVEDDGSGIDADTLAQVMTPFFTTKARGTGLGLPLARRLARAHGGDLVLDSAPGAGTKARLRIPPPTSEDKP